MDDGETYDYVSNKYIYAKITYEPDVMKYTWVSISNHYNHLNRVSYEIVLKR